MAFEHGRLPDAQVASAGHLSAALASDWMLTGKWVAAGMAPVGFVAAFLAISSFAETVADAADRQSRLQRILTFAIPAAVPYDGRSNMPVLQGRRSGKGDGDGDAGHGRLQNYLQVPILSVPADDGAEYGHAVSSDKVVSFSLMRQVVSDHLAIAVMAPGSVMGAPADRRQWWEEGEALPPPRPSIALGGSGLLPAIAPSAPKGSSERAPSPGPVESIPDDVPIWRRSDRGLEVVEKRLEKTRQRTASRRRRGRDEDRVVTVMERARAEFAPTGVKLGGFTLTSGFDLAALAQSNPLRMSGKSQSDISLTLGGDARLRSDWGRHSLELRGHVENRNYARLTSEDSTQWNVDGTAMLDIMDRSALSLTGGHGEFVVPRGNSGEVLRTAEPVRYAKSQASTNFVFEGAQVGGTLSAGIDRRDFRDAQSPSGGVVDEQFRDVTRKYIGGSAEILGVPGSAVSLSLQEEWFDYRINLGTDRDSRITSVTVGYRGEITPLIHGSVNIGLFHIIFADKANPSTTNPAIDAQIDWTVTPLTTFRLTAARDVESSADPRSSAQIRTAVSVGADHELLRNLILSATVTREASEFNGLAGKDERWREEFGVRWFKKGRLSANIVVEGEQRKNSISSGADYENYSLKTGVRYEF